MYDSMAAFRGDEYLWWQVAEYTFDTFQIRASDAADRPGIEYAEASEAFAPGPFFFAARRPTIAGSAAGKGGTATNVVLLEFGGPTTTRGETL